MNDLLLNLNKLYTTVMGVERIKRNLSINTNNVVEYCRNLIQKQEAIIQKKGKNWYITIENCIITVNSNSYTIITAHKIDFKR